MEILNLGGGSENSPARAPRKKLRVILGIGALAAVTGLGSTLAANISLNGGGNVEFGQGVATTAACDDSITLTPISTFSNTEEDPEFALTAIQVSGIDLTPEGRDVPNDTWVTGYVPRHYDSYLDDMVDATWSDAMKEHSGQYISGLDGNGDPIWTNTCANKSLMIRAYTDTAGYDYATDGWDIATPLMLSGNTWQRPNNNIYRGYNTGIGFRFVTYDFNLNGNVDTDSSTILYDRGLYSYGSAWNPMDYDFTYDGSSGTRDNSTYILYLDDDPYYPPVASKMVDKLTIESSATNPDGWGT